MKKFVVRRAILLTATILVAMLFLLGGCIFLAASNYPKSFLPAGIHVGAPIYSSSSFSGLFTIYKLEPSDAAMIDRQGIAWFSDKTTSRQAGLRSYNWHPTPMLTPDGLAFAGGRRENVSIAVMFARDANEVQAEAINKVRAAAENPGSFFAVNEGLDCGIIVDRKDLLVLVACEDIS